MSEDSVTLWMNKLKDGHVEEATSQLWQRYFERLVKRVRGRLRGGVRRAADEEDIAASALESVFRGIREERFPELSDRDNLWSLLVVIAERKAGKLVRRETAGKRGGGNVRGDSAVFDIREMRGGFDRFAGEEPTPEFTALVAEECQRLLAVLDDEVLQRIALGKMEGYTNEELAEQLQCAPVTIGRKLRLIRQRWERDAQLQANKA